MQANTINTSLSSISKYLAYNSRLSTQIQEAHNFFLVMQQAELQCHNHEDQRKAPQFL